MRYIVNWTLPQGTFNAATARFLETGGVARPMACGCSGAGMA
jgi:hypothetical protein